MPAMASLTVKKADGTTDVVYDALTSAGGDGSQAVWRQDTAAAAALPVGLRAMLTMSTVNNGPRTARRSVLTFKRPYAVLNTTTGRYESSDVDVARLEFTTPNAIPAADTNEAVYQFLNLAAHILIKQAVAAGYSPA
jgi:hypothetical protein